MEKTPELCLNANSLTEIDSLIGIKEYTLLESEEKENYLIKIG